MSCPPGQNSVSDDVWFFIRNDPIFSFLSDDASIFCLRTTSFPHSCINSVLFPTLAGAAHHERDRYQHPNEQHRDRLRLRRAVFNNWWIDRLLSQQQTSRISYLGTNALSGGVPAGFAAADVTGAQTSGADHRSRKREDN